LINNAIFDATCQQICCQYYIKKKITVGYIKVCCEGQFGKKEGEGMKNLTQNFLSGRKISRTGKKS
jgi:hypothetical protein